MADSQEHERRFQAQRGAQRYLSGSRPATPRERLAKLLDAPSGLDASVDFYGDGQVRALEERVAELLGKPDAAFFPTGTMAQQVALRCWAGRDPAGNPAVAMHPLGHIAYHEREAYTVLTGLRPVWYTQQARQPRAADLRSIDEPYATLVLELPLRDAGFLLPSWDELKELVAVARERGARVHFDGARLWESVVAWGVGLAEASALADSVYVSFYKTLGGLSGAAVAGPADFVAQAKAWRHRYGGNVFQQWPAAMAALSGIEVVLPKLPSYVAHARVVAEALSHVEGYRVYPSPPHTHQFQLWLPCPAEALNEATLSLAEQEKTWFAGGWRDQAGTGQAMAEVTILEEALEFTADDVIELATRYLGRVRGG